MQFSSLLHNYIITICIVVFGSGSRWVPVPSWGGLRNISTGKAGVWGTIDGHVYVRVGITNTKIYATSGTYWKFIGKY